MCPARLVEDARKEEADLWIINSCTVKYPRQAAMSSLLTRGRALGKRIVVSGCVPQGDKRNPELQNVSLLGARPANALAAGAALHVCWEAEDIRT